MEIGFARDPGMAAAVLSIPRPVSTGIPIARRGSFNMNAISVAPTTPFNYPIDQPPGLQVGDVTYLGLATNGSAGAITPPAGFTLLASNIAQNPRVYLFRKVNPGGDPGTWNIQGTAGVTAGVWSVAYIGVDQVTPEDVAAVATVNAAAMSAALNGLSTATAGAMLLALIAANSSTTTIDMTSPLLTEVVEVGGKKISANEGLFGLPGPTGPITYGLGGNFASSGILVALRPAVP